jgi:hypothetical protein
MLVFMSQAQVPACCGPWQLWAVNRDGTGLTNLSNDETVNDMGPSWSPDGTQIIFGRADASGGGLYTMPAPTSLPIIAAKFAAPKAAVASFATPLLNNAQVKDPDWGRDPSAPAIKTFKLHTVVTKNPGRYKGGKIVSASKGISCGLDCSQRYLKGKLVSLTAVPRLGFEFVGWSGSCSGTEACNVQMDDAKTVSATFRKLP